MTDLEFDLLDELYFIKSIEELTKTLKINELNITNIIWELIEKKWVKVLDLQDNELILNKEVYLERCKLVRFNVTKQGLLTHNQI